MGCSSCGQKYTGGTSTPTTNPNVTVVTPPGQRYNISQPAKPAVPATPPPAQPPK